MAFVPLVPVTLNITVNQGLTDRFTFPLVKSPTGTNIDLSAWTSLTCTAIAPAPGPCTADVDFGVVTGAAAGVLTMNSAAGDFASATPGNTRYIVKGKPTGGDAFQTLASGTMSLQSA